MWQRKTAPRKPPSRHRCIPPFGGSADSPETTEVWIGVVWGQGTNDFPWLSQWTDLTNLWITSFSQTADILGENRLSFTKVWDLIRQENKCHSTKPTQLWSIMLYGWWVCNASNLSQQSLPLGLQNANWDRTRRFYGRASFSVTPLNPS